MVRSVVTFGTVFVGFMTELVFFRTHLISFRLYVERPGSTPAQCLFKIENLALPNHFFLSSPYKACT